MSRHEIGYHMHNMLAVIAIMLLSCPPLAAGLLATYPLALRVIRRFSAVEYEQAVRAPAWFAVAIGIGITVLSFCGLLFISSSGLPVFICCPVAGMQNTPLFMMDAYTFWVGMLQGLVLAVTAWVPAARRSLVPYSVTSFLLVLLLVGCTQLMLIAITPLMILACWLVMLLGVLGLWHHLLHPEWRWRQWQPVFVLLLLVLFGLYGLLALHQLSHGGNIRDCWLLLSGHAAQPTFVAIMCITISWLGTAIYLPWWLWSRREEGAMIWMPVALLAAVTSMMTLVRLLLFTFAQYAGGATESTERFFLWLTWWGMIALCAGAGWLCWISLPRALAILLGGKYRTREVLLQRDGNNRALRPLLLVSGGLLLVGLAVALRLPGGAGVPGMLWALLLWVWCVAVWPVAGGILCALHPLEDQRERTVIQAALWVALAGIAGAPLLPGFRVLRHLWPSLQRFHLPVGLLGMALLLTLVCAGLLLPRWVTRQSCSSSRPGAKWAILGIIIFTLALVGCSLFARSLSPFFEAIRASLIQPM